MCVFSFFLFFLFSALHPLCENRAFYFWLWQQFEMRESLFVSVFRSLFLKQRGLLSGPLGALILAVCINAVTKAIGARVRLEKQASIGHVDQGYDTESLERSSI